MANVVNTPAEQAPSVQVVGGRSWTRRAAIGLVGVIALLGAAAWLLQRYTHVYVSDARVGATMVSVASRVPGWVEAVPISANDPVRTGDPVLYIDQRDARLRLSELDARLKGLEAELERQRQQLQLTDRLSASRLDAVQSQSDAAQARLHTAETNLRFAENELQRARSLHDQQLLAEHELDAKRTAAANARQGLLGAQADLATARAAVVEAEASRTQLVQIRQQIVQTQQRQAETEAARARQKNDLEDRVIRSPINGIVDETFINAGEFIGTGQRIALLHDPESVWIDANVKETDIRHLALGQRAQIRVDAYPDLDLTGTLVRIGQSTTGEFALLPNANPSGNFTKITQRIPVRFAINQVEGQLLRPGMMVEVAIEIR